MSRAQRPESSVLIPAYNSCVQNSGFLHSEGVLNFIVSWPYLTVSLFSLDIIWKFRILWIFSQNIKKLSIIGEIRPLIILKLSSLRLENCFDAQWLVYLILANVQSFCSCHGCLFFIGDYFVVKIIRFSRAKHPF